MGKVKEKMGKVQKDAILAEFERRPDLAEAFFKTISRGRWLITFIRSETVDPKHPENSIQNIWATDRMPILDALNGFETMIRDFRHKAEIKDPEIEDWH